MQHRRRRVVRLAIALAFIAVTGAALAQVPDHAPGSICATPTFWCWAQIWGQVGGPCYCGTAGGAVPGQYI